MKTSNVEKIYEIDVHLECICKGDFLVPLLSFCNEEIKKLVEEKYYAFFDDSIKVLPNINLINKKIEEYLKFQGVPKKILFTLDYEEDEYAYIIEVFTGIRLKADKVLLDMCKINKLRADLHLLRYSNKEIMNIYQILENAERETKNVTCKIIDFESRIRRRK